MLARRIALIVLAAVAATAQDYRARVQGVVSDSSHAVIPGARVVLRNNDTGIEAARVTGENGQYLFDFVEPGTYSLLAEQTGFNRFTRQDIPVQVRGDVTVNARLSPGAVSETVTITGAPPAVEFNTSTVELTVDRKMLTDLPVLGRSAFALALLDSSVVSIGSTARVPYQMWTSTRLNVGGPTAEKNDLLLDGAPLEIGRKGSYVPPMDSIQEFTVQQNSVDAEFGHSGGGAMSISMKSGTNELHGTAYYFGRNPALNAVTSAVVRSQNLVRNHIWGVSAGGPIRKNKLFNYAVYEGWRLTEPISVVKTLPTDLERTGDYSQSKNGSGGLRAIYDPWSTLFEAASGKVTRTAFAGNRIPASRMDPTAQVMLKDVYLPNGPGDDQTHINNYKTAAARYTHYKTFSDRADWNINDRWKMYARASRFATLLDPQNYSGTRSLDTNGGHMNATNISGDTVYTLDPRTVLNFRFSYAAFVDDLVVPCCQLSESDLAEFWPNNAWYKPYLKDAPAIYYPLLNIGAKLGRDVWWYQHPHNYSSYGRVSRQEGAHYLKAGVEMRNMRTQAVRPNLMSFTTSAATTANTFISPNTKLSGDSYAAFLLGAIDSSSQAQYIPLQKIAEDYYGAYFQDDFKVSRRITLNLGLRYEFDNAPRDAEDRYSRFLDLTDPIPEMQAAQPRMPDLSKYTSAKPVYNGAWVFTDSSHRGTFETGKTKFMPRLGIAIRLNDRTALRAGYARYIVPSVNVVDTLGSAPMPGFGAVTTTAPSLEGVPGARLSNPFPATNPLIMPVDKSLGRYTNLGGDATWEQQQMKTAINDRIHVSLQRQLPARFTTEVTWQANLGRDWPYDSQLNLVDPQLSYTHKSALEASVDNPFYNYATAAKFPGQLRNQAKVKLSSLLKPYPQYGNLTQTNTNGVMERYQELKIRVQRPFARGFSLFSSYSYVRERQYEFFNSDDQYAGRLTFQPSPNPRHRWNTAGSWDVPLGHGRTWMSHAHPVLNAVFGGWSMSGISNFVSGQFIRFGSLLATGDPRVSSPTRERWFNTSVFQQLPAYTPRTNPLQYPGLTGPRAWSMDANLSKYFRFTERVRLEVKLEAYNATNSFMAGNPSTSVTSSLFGKSTSQANLGREVQYSLRLHF
jgi:hypothetical protein